MSGEEEKPDRFLSTLRCEVVKPLGMSWDELGNTLRGLRAPLHRVLNAAMAELELYQTAKDRQIPVTYWSGMVKSRKPKSQKGPSPKPTPTHPRSLCYQLVSRAWDKERIEARARIAKGKSYAFDKEVAELEPAGPVQLGAAGTVYARWKKFDKERWKGTMSIPSFNKHPPIWVASSNDAVGLETKDGIYILTLKLLGGRKNVVKLVVRPEGPSDYASVRKILQAQLEATEDAPAQITLGDCKLIEDDRGPKKKWQALLSWSRPKATVSGGHTMAIHRGIRNFLTFALSDPNNSRTSILMQGESIVAHKIIYTSRRKALSRHGHELGRGAKGHGLDRRYERITRVQDAEARWVDNMCKQIAADTIKRAQQFGVTRILIEDWANPTEKKNQRKQKLDERLEYYVRNFPLGQLRSAIERCAAKHGLTVEERSTTYNSRRCPVCKTLNDASSDPTFRCSKCRLERDRDRVFVWNMLVDEGFPVDPLLDMDNKSLKKLVEIVTDAA